MRQAFILSVRLHEGGERKVFQRVPIPYGHVSAVFTQDFTSYAELAPAGEAHEVLTPHTPLPAGTNDSDSRDGAGGGTGRRPTPQPRGG